MCAVCVFDLLQIDSVDTAFIYYTEIREANGPFACIFIGNKIDYDIYRKGIIKSEKLEHFEYEYKVKCFEVSAKFSIYGKRSILPLYL